MKFIGGLIGLVIWGFCIAFGFWCWNEVANRWATPALDDYIEKKKALKAAKPDAPAVQG